MAKIKTTKRYNESYTPIGVYYDFGGDLKQALDFKNMKNASASPLSRALGAAGQLVGQVGGTAISGGLESGAGKVFSGLNNIASAIPGPWGAVASAGLGIIGGLTNRMFGSKLNHENIAKVEGDIDRMNSTRSDAGDFDTLNTTMANTVGKMDFSNSYIGKDGWFSNKSKNKANALREANNRAAAKQSLAFINNAEQISADQLGRLEANYAAFGGPIFSTGAIGYDLATKDLNSKQMKVLGDMRLTSLPNSFSALPDVSSINTFSKGGGIHIKKKNRGKFTDYCGGKVTSECIQRGLHSSNPTTRRRANFARNARKWHSFGGWLNSQGGDFTNGVTFIDNGGSHEANPFEGVQMGIDPQGVPNLVEEGEVIFNDYVFSDRMKLPKKLKEKYSIKGETFADAAKELSKESEERPNDPISQRGLEAFMSALAESQEEVRIKNEDRRMNRYAKGGKLGKLFEGDGPDDNYMDFGTLASPISVEQLERMMNLGIDGSAIPLTGTSKEIDDAITRAAVKKGATTGNKYNLSYLRYAPALMSGISAFTDLFSKPDYSAADRVASVNIQPALVSTSPIGQYLSYRPMDRMFYINQLNKNAAAGRRAIQNTTGGNRAAALAGILAADYNYGENLGQLARQAEEYNQAQRERVAGFNRQTDMFNSQQSMQAQSVNAQSRNDATKMRLAQAEEVAKLRQAARDAYNARRSNNLNSFITNLGNIGWEEKQAEWLDNLAKRGVLLMNTSGEYTGGVNKNGGKLKKKRRTTYA